MSAFARRMLPLHTIRRVNFARRVNARRPRIQHKI